MWDMTRPCVWHDSFICATWLAHLWDMTHLYVQHDSLICVTWLIQMWDMPHSYVQHDSFICVAWLAHMCDMTRLYMCGMFIHSCVWHDSFICATWLAHMCAMTRLYMCGMPPSFKCVTWLIHMRDMTHSYAWPNSLICARWFVHTCAMTHTDVQDVTHSYVQHAWFVCVWRDTFQNLQTKCESQHLKRVAAYDSFICDMTHVLVPWLIHMCAMFCSNVRDVTHECWVTGLVLRFNSGNIWMSHVTHTNESCPAGIQSTQIVSRINESYHTFFFWWVLQHCTGFARLVWGRLRLHRAFVYSKHTNRVTYKWVISHT